MGTSYLLVQVQKQEEGYFLVAARCLFMKLVPYHEFRILMKAT